MIWDSCYWKGRLKRLVRPIEKQVKSNQDNDITGDELEYSLFSSAFCARKLIESKKLTDAVSDMNVKCICFDKTNAKIATHYNFYKIEQLFDFSSKRKGTVKFENLCNQLIHSFCFVLGRCDGSYGFFVSSDYDKQKILFFVSMQDYLVSCQMIINDCVTDSEWSIDDKCNESLSNKCFVIKKTKE